MSTEERALALELYKIAFQTRNLEITLFWQRSNYFLVLNTAIAAGFVSKPTVRLQLLLSGFGLLVAGLWVAVNLGGKFWQARWEQKLAIVEQSVAPQVRLFSATWKDVRTDVEESLRWRPPGPVGTLYNRCVLFKPSVTKVMTLLSCAFMLFWLCTIALIACGHGT